MIKQKIRQIIRYYFLPLIFITCLSCTPSESYLISAQATTRAIERADHQNCIAQGIDFDEWNDSSTEIYWRCRYKLIQNKIIQDAITVEDIQNNIMIKKISEKILANLKKSSQEILYNIEDDYETVALSNKQLTQTHQNYVRKSEIDFVNNMMKKYPTCRNVNVKSKLFKECSDAQEESAICLSKINDLGIKKELDDKIYCQQQAFIQFPDNYSITSSKSATEIERLLKKEREERIQRLREEKEKQVNRTKAFFEKGFISQDTLFNSEEATIAKTEKMKKEEIRDKMQILDLREEFIEKCTSLMQQKFPNYLGEETRKCNDIGKDWDKRDDEAL